MREASTGSIGNNGVESAPFFGSGAGDVPVEIQGCPCALSPKDVHLCSRPVPHPTVSCGAPPPNRSEPPVSSVNQLLPVVDTKAYPQGVANQGRALLTIVISLNFFGALWTGSKRSLGAGAPWPIPKEGFVSKARRQDGRDHQTRRTPLRPTVPPFKTKGTVQGLDASRPDALPGGGRLQPGARSRRFGRPGLHHS